MPPRSNHIDTDPIPADNTRVFEFRDIRVCSHPKSPGVRSEDAFAVAAHCLVLADGATAKTEFTIAPDRSGGEIVATLVAECAVRSTRNGIELVAELNCTVSDALREYGVTPESHDPRMPSCVFACARICGDRLIITQVGDAGIRIDGPSGKTLSVHNPIDDLTSSTRAHYIRLTGDVEGSRDFILPLLRAQSAYRNNARHPLGFGVIDGVATPDSFVVTRSYDLSGIQTIEIFSDGYPAVPDTVLLEAWEDAYRNTLRNDPDRCLAYPSTKSLDDRTIILANIVAAR